MKLPDLEIRIQQLFDDELTEEQFAELEIDLLNNPEAMELYLSYSGLDSDLKHHSDYQKKAEQLPIVPVKELLDQQRKRAIRFSMLSAAAVLIIVAVIMWMQQVPETSDTLADVRATPGSDFSLSHQTDGAPPTGNAMADNSRLILRHGVVELQLPHDVRAVIEAPADISLVDARTLKLQHGRAYFKVSSTEGQGFTVVTPHQRIVDLGTAFGINCQNGKTDVELHVLEGSVRVDSLKEKKGETVNAPRSVLLAGSRIRLGTINSPTAFLKSLPEKIDILLKADFETGLVANRDYVIKMDPTVIRDLAGNQFKGINGDTVWKFTTARQAGTVLNFSFEQNIVSLGSPVEHWPELSGTKASFNTAKFGTQLNPTHGDTFLMVDGSKDMPRVFAQDLGSMITAGTTYRLMVDVASTRKFPLAQGFIRLFGSDAGYQSTLAETIVSPPTNKWLRDQTLTFTADASHKTGQTIGIALGCSEGRMVFDNVRLIPIERVSTEVKSIPQTRPGSSAIDNQDTTPPAITKLHPANKGNQATPGDNLIITFDEPVKLGTGRIFINCLNNVSESELIVGDPRISVDGQFLTIRPHSKLADGTAQMGRINGWNSNGWVGTFNPNGKENGYFHEDFNDRGKSEGNTGAMHGPTMATISTIAINPEIRRNIGKIKANHHYSISAAIGVRAENADTSSFPGYTIRLLSDDTTLAVLSSDTPPGPTNNVHAIGFSWDSSKLPEGIQLGDPLTIVISPNQSGSPGFLDIDNIRVSATRQSEKNN